MASKAYASGQVRLIGGEWRSRCVQFESTRAIRPTPDRVRETLFNWLMSDVVGACCLDLFAGSGALGFEALSRGASEVVMCDADNQVRQQLLHQADKLGANGLNVLAAYFPVQMPDLSAWQFDGVFLDPPFSQVDIEQVLVWLDESVTLKASAWIFCEWARSRAEPNWPQPWQLVRSLETRHVHAGLLRQKG